MFLHLIGLAQNFDCPVFASTTLPSFEPLMAGSYAEYRAGAKMDTLRLVQEDFANGSVVLDRPIYTQLQENIAFEPVNAMNLTTGAIRCDVDPYQLYCTAGGTRPKNGFVLGFFAAIVISSSHVSIDLNGYEIKHGPTFVTLQRFASVIELGASPFISGQGPATFAGIEELSNIFVLNGVIGRSSHHGIHGNEISNVLLKDIVFRHYEIAAISISGASNVRMENIRADGHWSNVVHDFKWSQALFMLREMPPRSTAECDIRYESMMRHAFDDKTFAPMANVFIAYEEFVHQHANNILSPEPFVLPDDGMNHTYVLNFRQKVYVNAPFDLKLSHPDCEDSVSVQQTSGILDFVHASRYNVLTDCEFYLETGETVHTFVQLPRNLVIAQAPSLSLVHGVKTSVSDQEDEFGLVKGNVYAISVGGKGVIVNEFQASPACSEETSKCILLSNVTVRNAAAAPRSLRSCQGSDTRGGIADFDEMCSEPDSDDCVFTGPDYTNELRALIGHYVHCAADTPEVSQFLSRTKWSMNNLPFYEFVFENQPRHVAFKYDKCVCGSDMMSHTNKGVFGIFIQTTSFLVLKNVVVERVLNLAPALQTLCGAFTTNNFTNQAAIELFKHGCDLAPPTHEVPYFGSVSHGISIVNPCSTAYVENISTTGLSATGGCRRQNFVGTSCGSGSCIEPSTVSAETLEPCGAAPICWPRRTKLVVRGQSVAPFSIRNFVLCYMAPDGTESCVRMCEGSRMGIAAGETVRFEGPFLFDDTNATTLFSLDNITMSITHAFRTVLVGEEDRDVEMTCDVKRTLSQFDIPSAAREFCQDDPHTPTGIVVQFPSHNLTDGTLVDMQCGLHSEMISPWLYITEACSYEITIPFPTFEGSVLQQFDARTYRYIVGEQIYVHIVGSSVLYEDNGNILCTQSCTIVVRGGLNNYWANGDFQFRILGFSPTMQDVSPPIDPLNRTSCANMRETYQWKGCCNE